MNYSEFKTLEQFKEYYDSFREVHTAKTASMPIEFKKALVEYISRNELSLPFVTNFMGMSNSILYTWRKQHNADLYHNPSAVYAVSQKHANAHDLAIAKLNKKKKKIDKQIEVIKKAKAAGLDIIYNIEE